MKNPFPLAANRSLSFAQLFVFLSSRRARPSLRRPVSGGRQPGPQNREAGRVPPQSSVRADARHLHLRDQHHGREGLQALRVPHLQEAGKVS